MITFYRRLKIFVPTKGLMKCGSEIGSNFQDCQLPKNLQTASTYMIKILTSSKLFVRSHLSLSGAEARACCTLHPRRIATVSAAAVPRHSSTTIMSDLVIHSHHVWYARCLYLSRSRQKQRLVHFCLLPAYCANRIRQC